MIVGHHSNNNICFHLILKCILIKRIEKKKKRRDFFSFSPPISLLFEESIDDDQADHNDEHPVEKNDLRISQSKYSQLLKGLDFSHSRMVNNNSSTVCIAISV